MELTVYIIITWFVVTYFITALPEADLVKNIILYMLLIILLVSASTILYMNLELINLTKDRIKFVSVVLCRNVVTPLLLVIFSNIFCKLKTYLKKTASIILILFLLLSIELLNLQLCLHTYVRWNFMLCIPFYCFFIFTTVMLNKGLYIFQKRGDLSK
jgi:hypothetical protein